MIIGHGDIARALRSRDIYCKDWDWIYFASGVSNSGEIDESEYEREIEMMRSLDMAAHVVYFSSLCIFYSHSRYALHKAHMEGMAASHFRTCTILRLGNITWGDNPHTLINYLRAHPNAPIQDTYRYIVDKDEFLHWVGLIPDWSCEMNVPGRRMKVAEIYQEFVVNEAIPALR